MILGPQPKEPMVVEDMEGDVAAEHTTTTPVGGILQFVSGSQSVTPKVGDASNAAKSAAGGVIRSGVHLGAKATVHTVAGALAVKHVVGEVIGGAVQDAGYAVAKTTQGVYEKHVSEETREKIKEKTDLAQQKATESAQAVGQFASDQAGSVYGTYQDTKQFVREQVKEGFDQLPEDTKEKLIEQRVQAIVAREQLKARVLDLTGEGRTMLFRKLTESVKQKWLRDRDIPQCVKRRAGRAYDDFFLDVQKEIDLMLEESVLLKVVEDEDAKKRPEGCCAPWRWFRAFILHNYFPFDRSIFGQIRNPFWWLFFLLTLVPFYNVRVTYFFILLLCILFPCPPDEYILTEFILRFKGAQMLTGGIIASLLGNASYFFCHKFGNRIYVGETVGLDEHCLSNYAPWNGDFLWFQIADFFGSSILVWVAFCSLRRSKRKDNDLIGRQKKPREDDAKQEEKKVPSCCGVASVTRGGRLLALAKYDSVVFCIVLLALAGLVVPRALDDDHTRDTETFLRGVSEDLYFARCVYSFLSAPFVIFLISPLRRILTHCKRTGFDKRGNVHFFAPREVLDKDKDDAKKETAEE